MGKKGEDQDQLKKIMKEIVDHHDANLAIYSDSIDSNTVDHFIKSILALPEHNRKPILVIALTTYGGDPNAAYRLVRFIKKKYKKLILLIYGYCKSAGTLVTLGADEIVMSDFAELGPLDVQLTKDDELVYQSGLDYIIAFNAIYENAYNTYEQTFLRLKAKSSGTITTKTAAEIASSLATGLYAPMLSNIDPIKIGEVHRALRVAQEYGKRICKNEEIVEKLTIGYTSHSFAIDFIEAKEMFSNVREPNELEYKLQDYIYPVLRKPTETIYVYEEDRKEEKDGSSKQKDTEQNDNNKDTVRKNGTDSEEAKQNAKTNSD